MAATLRTSIVDLLVPWAETIPDSVAVRTPPGPDRVSLSQLRFLGEIGAARDRYRAAGLRPGDRTVLIAPSCPEFLIEFLGAHAAGLATVAVNPLSTARELVYILEDSDALRLVAHPAMAEPGRLAAGEKNIGFDTLPLVGNEGPSLQLGDDGAAEFDRVEFEWDDLAALLYTSGTTGKPKGAMLSVGNFIATTDIVKEMTQTSPEDRSATGLPLFHVFGLADMALPALSAGAPLTLFPRWDPQAFVDALTEDEISIISGVPTMWMSVLTNAGGAATPNLRLVSSGGAAIAGEVIRKVEARFSAPVAEGYGLTETAGLGTFNPLFGTRKVGSVGPSTPGLRSRSSTSTVRRFLPARSARWCCVVRRSCSGIGRNPRPPPRCSMMTAGSAREIWASWMTTGTSSSSTESRTSSSTAGTTCTHAKSKRCSTRFRESLRPAWSEPRTRSTDSR